ncbi:calcium-binding protein [Streptomyces sp. ISL-12]|uniref:calcium-binding protein n=1 Tax=Streptomyces sp. ISL-12 TaxID=2819177 RepID=UPI001BECB2CA|nr:calcium-binding protein [Streptomyces sp. ISL-12]MBT2411092.1 calcium-binding protein [Streptomyces sp. ISL-12]
MRMRATVAAVSGALALSALAVPAAQADSTADSLLQRPTAADVFGAEAHRSTARSAAALPTITSVSVNGGKDVVVGTTTAKTFTVSVTATHASGITDAFVELWHGTDFDTYVDGALVQNQEYATCTAASATKSTCKLTITARPGYDDELVGYLYDNALAGSWKVNVAVLANDGSVYQDTDYKTVKVQRLSKLTVNAAPEPVKKGATLTVTGKLTRADWEAEKYVGIPSGQSVALQFRKANSSAYSNVKGIKTTSGGALKTTVKAAADGYHRFNYKGITSTAASVAAGDYVDVK